MILLFLVDIVTIIFDAYISLIIRFKVDNVYYNQVPGEYMTSLNSYIIINVVTTLVIFLVLNLYNRVWSYASLHEGGVLVGVHSPLHAREAAGVGHGTAVAVVGARGVIRRDGGIQHGGRRLVGAQQPPGYRAQTGRGQRTGRRDAAGIVEGHVGGVDNIRFHNSMIKV